MKHPQTERFCSVGGGMNVCAIGALHNNGSVGKVDDILVGMLLNVTLEVKFSNWDVLRDLKCVYISSNWILA